MKYNMIRIVLINTTHPGNIGAVARAMKNMGLSRLYLVNPNSFPSAEATARAAGADDILQTAVVVNSPLEAISDCQLVIGTSARIRELPIELLNPKEAVQKAISETKQGHEVAIIFGTESSGLSNEELKLCHYHMHIPTNNQFASLNLAAAVLIVAYEISSEMIKVNAQNSIATFAPRVLGAAQVEELATAKDLELFLEHLEKVLLEIKFLDAEKPRRLMERLRRIFTRARLAKTEINILRGILTGILRKLRITND